MNIQKAAAVVSSGAPTGEQLEKIHCYSKSPLKAEEVYCFSVRLCDDQVDRDFERFDTQALAPLARLFRGKTGICDHNWSTREQVARIFDTEVLCQEDVHYIRAQCYILRSEKNADLIRDIEGGIKKEVSVGCAMGRTVCSLCGQPYGTCEHRKGLTYDGETCVGILTDPVDAYEFSFVAVPAQKEAGVVKSAKGGEPMTLTEIVSVQGDPELARHLKSLEQEAKFGRDCRNLMVKEAVSLALLLDFGGDTATLEKAFSALSPQELSDLKKSMAQKTAALFPPVTQLPKTGSLPAALDNAYMI